MFQYQTIEPGTLQLLKQLQELPLLKASRLVGGTALALQLGHRKSVDLDLFGAIDAGSEELLDALSDAHSLTVVKESRNINIYLIDGIKVDIVNYKYEWIDKPVEEEAIILAGIKDIAAMKIAAVVGRGTKKDFIDLYFLLRQYSLKEILQLYLQKYPDGSLFIAMKSLTYFEDAETEPMPFMFENVNWEDVKARIRQEVAKL